MEKKVEKTEKNEGKEVKKMVAKTEKKVADSGTKQSVKSSKTKETKGDTKKKVGIGRIILIIIAVLVVLLIVHTFRNYYIILSMQNKILEYKDSTNFHFINVSNWNDGTKVTMNYYKKGEKQAVFIDREGNDKTVKMSMYDNGKRVDNFYEVGDSKTAKLGGGMISVEISNRLETANAMETLATCIGSRIKSVKYNGKDCYAIKGVISSLTIASEDETIYVYKDTGLLAGSENDNEKAVRETEFNNVSDSVFVEPDISEYTLQGSN